ncbi:hypothetical protein N9C70_00545 [Flavobacteriales bacterium]|nr:hypothetical protein [Flavobacteriales bacterium]
MAAEFGPNRWIEVTQSESIDFASGDSLTWSVWVKTAPSNVGQTIFHKWNGIVQTTSYPLQAAVSNTGEQIGSQTFCVNNQSSHGYVNTSIELGVWTHALMTQNSDSTILYINGLPVDTGLVNQTGCSNNTSLTFGRKFGVYPRYFQGKMDDFGLWNRVLSEEEIQSLYINDLTVGCTNPTACNYEPDSNLEDGSCVPSGCTEEEACNFNPEAGCDDSSCVFPPQVDLGGAITLCEGEVFTLAVDASGLDVLWNTGATESSITVSESGAYNVQIGDASNANYRLEFDGVDDYVSFGSSLNITSYPFSIQADISAPDEGYFFPILYTDDGTDGYSGFWLQISATTLQINVGEGQNGGSSNRRSKSANHGLTIGDYATVSAVVRGATDMSLYVNGIDIGGSYSGSGNTNFIDNGLDAVTGRYTHSSGSLENQVQYYNGSIDNLQVWTKALTAEESAQYAAQPATGTESGLLALYSFNEGSGETTTDNANGNVANLFGSPSWTKQSNICGASDTVSVYFIDCATLCGPGTHWDFITSSCIISAPTDVDLDGCTGVGDVLEVLSQFGACYPLASEVWTCGDPLTYWNYDYATVLIGDQCWFAENLRSDKYLDGSTISHGLSDTDWASTTQGAATIYGQDSPNCVESGNTAITTCTDAIALDEYGRLYNWFAVNDPHNLCPETWRVTSEADWQSLIEWGASSVTSGCLSCELKSTTDWSGGVGSNSLGWNGKAGGSRIHLPSSSNGYWDSGYSGFWWTSTESTASSARSRWMGNGNGVFGGEIQKALGLSVRCIKDTE